ncbi:MAG TPA: hypothetical protein VEK33_18560, partial [Terriglobales bacterium]|nr:hypothetical protein [Terriglobales bacterium]
ISLLYQERDRLQSDMHKVWRLQFLVLANAVLRLRRASLRLLSHLKARIGQMLSPRSRGGTRA